ncbi:MAG: bifunctional oligoribonuclease/PAP phosphatase NrnA [Chitinophagales bacterium]|nr:bifunctional oligoribonuclease/PAP phosphatase NrnA [Chitinophagales bacterium]
MNFEKENILNRIKQAKSIVITSHVSPDGDAIGSSLAMYHFIASWNSKVEVLVPNDFPNFLNWLEGSENIRLYDKNVNEGKALLSNADILFCLDYNETSRTAFMKEAIDNSKAFKILIDHHIGSPSWPDLNLSVVGASSTCELVFDFIKSLNPIELSLNKNLAECLYTGLLTDTGNFQFSATTTKVHLQVAELIEAGVMPDVVHNHINNSFDVQRLQFFGYCIAEKMKILKQYKLAYMFVSVAEMHRYNIQTGGTEGLVNEPMKIADIDISVLFKEDKDKIKISFRSKRDIDVSSFANRFYEGGGHRNAAGGVSLLSMEETEKQFIERLGYFNIV